MSTIIFVVSLLWPAPGSFSTVEKIADIADTVQDDGPMRYRGVERLLARFEAEAAARDAQNL